jgi:hypothetical protein
MRKLLLPVAALVLAFAACSKEGATDPGKTGGSGTDSTSTPGVNKDSVVTFTDVAFALQPGNSTYGRVFASQYGKVFTDKAIADTMGKHIDVVFNYLGAVAYFGSANEEGFDLTVPGATTTIFKNYVTLNDQITVNNFDTLVHASTINKLTFVDDGNSFDPTALPVLIYFQNSWNKKGLIKVKSVSADHITADVKVMY